MSDLYHGDAAVPAGLIGSADGVADAAATPTGDEDHSAVIVASDTLSSSQVSETEVTADEKPSAAVPDPDQPALMAGADKASDTQRPPFAALVRKVPEKRRAPIAPEMVALAWVKRVAKSVLELQYVPQWSAGYDAAPLPARLWLIREMLVNLTGKAKGKAKAPREFGLVDPGPVAQQTRALLLEVVEAIGVRSMTRDGEERFWGEWNPAKGAKVLERLREFAVEREAATPDFLETFSPIQQPTVGVDAALANVARALLRHLPQGDKAAVTGEI